VYVDGVAYERGVDPIPEKAPNTDRALWGDAHYANTRGPNGEDLSSRTKHREFLKQTGLTTMDDFKSTWDVALKKKAEYVTQGKGAAVKREHIERAIHELTTRKR
jgi:hypothetical protein